MAFSVIDTGIGIPPDKLRLIFEAFQQAEGSISRRFGGTGLGLSISREIARLLGGEIHVSSAEGQGSTFTLYLPVAGPVPLPVATAPVLDEPAPLPPAATRARRRTETAALPDTLTDDRADLPAGERVALVMTGDRALARGAVEVAHEHGFRCLLALRGDAGLALVHEFMPDAVIVSKDLPQLNGEAVLEHVKRHPGDAPPAGVRAGRRRLEARPAARRRARLPHGGGHAGAARRRVLGADRLPRPAHALGAARGERRARARRTRRPDRRPGRRGGGRGLTRRGARDARLA